jgi:hypothetical protein
MPGDRLHGTSCGIAPQRVRSPLALQITSMLSEVLQKSAPLHSTITVSRSASAGTPRSESSRLSSKISAMASAKLVRASSFDRPCPLAPGISGQYAMYQSPSRSMMAVNSLRIGTLHSSEDSILTQRSPPDYRLTCVQADLGKTGATSILSAMAFGIGIPVILPPGLSRLTQATASVPRATSRAGCSFNFRKIKV